MARTALITGASSGVGQLLAERLADQGAKVVIAARREPELRELERTIVSRGGEVVVAPMDVADTEATVARIRELDEELGGLELVIANAGIGTHRGREMHSWEKVREVCQVDFMGAVATLTAVLPRMIERGRGHLVGVSSLAAYGPLPRTASYCASKAGLSMFLESLRLDLLNTGVGVTTIHMGYVRTPLTAKNAHKMPAVLEREEAVDIILGRLAERPATIDFPTSLALATRMAGSLPRGVRDLLIKRGVFMPRARSES